MFACCVTRGRFPTWKNGTPTRNDAPAAPEIPADAPADDNAGTNGGLDLIDGATLAFGVVVLLNILGLNPFGPKPPGQ